MGSLKKIFSDNFMLIGTFCCFLCAVELLRVPIYGATFIMVLTQPPGNYDFVEILVRMLIVIADAAVLSLPAMFVRRRWVVFLWIFLFDVYCLIQSWYISVYQDIMPFSHFLLFENVNGVLLRSVGGLLSWRDLLFFLPLAAFILLSVKFRSIKKYRLKPVVVYVSSFLCMYAVSVVYNLITDKYENRYSRFQQYLSCYLDKGYVCDNGFVPFVVYSLSNLFDSKDLSEEELGEIENFLGEKPKYSDDLYAYGKGKNLIFILVESLNSWYLEREVCGMEITPNSKRHIKEHGTG